MTKITPTEVSNLLNSRREEVEKFLESPEVTDLYQSMSIRDGLDYENDFPEHKEKPVPDWLFGDSYVGDNEFDFLTYCICNYLGVDSGIHETEAYTCLTKLLAESLETYIDHLQENSTLAWHREHNPGRDVDEAIEAVQKKGIDPAEVTTDGDDPGDEYANPIWFLADAEKFAIACNCKELALYIKPVSVLGKWLDERIHLW